MRLARSRGAARVQLGLTAWQAPVGARSSSRAELPLRQHPVRPVALRRHHDAAVPAGGIDGFVETDGLEVLRAARDGDVDGAELWRSAAELRAHVTYAQRQLGETLALSGRLETLAWALETSTDASANSGDTEAR